MNIAIIKETSAANARMSLLRIVSLFSISVRLLAHD
jgi:hypothetical protein